ncbi:hypothetical protein B0J14DRAFT_353327 [Halenospora varia]|nr:hypothetical protein B0J14DRAFT_353327 [Halenospora varia]
MAKACCVRVVVCAGWYCGCNCAHATPTYGTQLACFPTLSVENHSCSDLLCFLAFFQSKSLRAFLRACLPRSTDYAFLLNASIGSHRSIDCRKQREISYECLLMGSLLGRLNLAHCKMQSFCVLFADVKGVIGGEDRLQPHG